MLQSAENFVNASPELVGRDVRRFVEGVRRG